MSGVKVVFTFLILGVALVGVTSQFPLRWERAEKIVMKMAWGCVICAVLSSLIVIWS